MRRRPVMRGAARTAVVAGTATAVSGRVARRQNRRFQEQDQAAYQQEPVAEAPAPAPVPAAPAAPAMPVVEQLKELAQLRDQGVLTDAEFEQQKAKILAG